MALFNNSHILLYMLQVYNPQFMVHRLHYAEYVKRHDISSTFTIPLMSKADLIDYFIGLGYRVDISSGNSNRHEWDLLNIYLDDILIAEYGMYGLKLHQLIPDIGVYYIPWTMAPVLSFKQKCTPADILSYKELLKASHYGEYLDSNTLTLT